MHYFGVIKISEIYYEHSRTITQLMCRGRNIMSDLKTCKYLKKIV